ncbi:efflux RND transporter periplasmic adaptor subunit [Defluviitalea raffinosedens]|uniref:Efflux RND transporter periplasmic adaptor subunit n=1 Tax=Defluviitalea raffinosedens TaxID=1450156 RepID=A0A7C8LUD1_9FIRM|nr:efflux RND transporter periplasmic adaptor subunit [Defluviitalea raffinosedens]KAE9636282.1 efflux RND transporter periplasmic adaptor subunit [Defluviitalea raffinosedens]
MKMKRLIPMVLALGILTAGCGQTNQEVMNETEEKATPVKVEQVSKGQISNTFTYGGKINPKQQITVSSKIAGKVKAVNFDIGDVVKAGDILFTLDETDLKNTIRTLEAQIKSAEAAVNMSKVGLNSAKGSQQEQQKNQLESNLQMAEIKLQDAKKAYEDMKALYEIGSASKQQLDQMKTAYDTAAIGYNSAKEAYDLFINKLSKESVEQAQTQVAQAMASKESLEVQLANAYETLKDAAVRSPIDGIVSSRTIDAGEMVSGAVAPFTIIQMDTVFVEVNVSEQVINKLEKGQKVDVYVSSAFSEPFEGTIYAISPAADQTFTYPVKIEIPNKDGLLKPGMFAEVEFAVDTVKDALIVPREAVLNEGDIYYVYIVEGDRAKKTEVKLGLDNGKEVEVVEGLTEGAQLIVKGQNYLEDGGKVQITEN